jgi:hypothetical protein
VIKMVAGYSKSELKAWEDYQRSFGKIVSEPVVEFGRYGDYWLVGHGEVTNSECDTFKKFMGCLNIEAHNSVRWIMPDLAKNSVFIKSVYHSCDNPLCPKCYKYGWATREAGRIEARLKESSKRFGLIEHIVVSVPDNDYGLSLENLRKKCVKILSVRGVIGGCLIFHAFRYRNSIESRRSRLPIGWFWSPHFHVLGFIGGEGYGKCRCCAFNPTLVHNSDRCRECNGFEGLTRRCYEKEGGRAGSGYIVKVLGKRKTVGGTAWYQCNHASVRRGVNSKKSHVATWFGVCSYRKLKLINGKDVGIKHKCPICGNDLVRVRYLGDFSQISISRGGEIVSFYDEDRKPLWEVVTERKFQGG